MCLWGVGEDLNIRCKKSKGCSNTKGLDGLNWKVPHAYARIRMRTHVRTHSVRTVRIVRTHSVRIVRTHSVRIVPNIFVLL